MQMKVRKKSMSWLVYQNSLSEAEFEAAAKRTRVSEKNIAAARRIMVDGESVKDVATDLQVSTVSVTTVCRRILEQSPKSSWVILRTSVPAELHDTLLSFINQKIEEHGAAK